MKKDFTPEARELISEIYRPEKDKTSEDEAWLRGRTWGMAKFNDGNNPYKGTNITIAIGDELISICQPRKKLVVHQFKRVRSTALGRRVRKLLAQKFTL